MKALWTYIDDAITKGIVRNDAEIARGAGVSRATVSRWRSGDRIPSDLEARKLATIIGANELELLAEVSAARAKDPATRAAWERMAAMCSRIAASLALAVATLFFSHSPEIQAASTTYDAVNAGNTNYRSFWNRLRNAWSRLADRWRAAEQPPHFAGS